MSDPKARIINHMNKDHKMALIDYLVVYGKIKLPMIKESSVKMTNVNEKGMSISFKDILTNKVQNMIILWEMTPEDENVTVTSMSDIKAKLVAMAKFAGKAQGYSHIKITKLPKPGFTSYILFFTFLLLIVESFLPKVIRSTLNNDFIFSKAAEYVPSTILSGIVYVETHANPILLGLLTIHLAEIIFILLPRLAKYRVPINQRLIWVIIAFFDGFSSLQRLNDLTK